MEQFIIITNKCAAIVSIQTKEFKTTVELFKTYVVGTQKNRLGETVLLSTHNICFD